MVPGTGMINSEYNINNGVDFDTCENDGGTVWTYNQGVILGGLVELNKAAPDESYLAMAEKIAIAAIENLSDSNGIHVSLIVELTAPNSRAYSCVTSKFCKRRSQVIDLKVSSMTMLTVSG